MNFSCDIFHPVGLRICICYIIVFFTSCGSIYSTLQKKLAILKIIFNICNLNDTFAAMLLYKTIKIPS